LFIKFYKFLSGHIIMFLREKIGYENTQLDYAWQFNHLDKPD